MCCTRPILSGPLFYKSLIIWQSFLRSNVTFMHNLLVVQDQNNDHRATRNSLRSNMTFTCNQRVAQYQFSTNFCDYMAQLLQVQCDLQVQSPILLNAAPRLILITVNAYKFNSPIHGVHGFQSNETLLIQVFQLTSLYNQLVVLIPSLVISKVTNLLSNARQCLVHSNTCQLNLGNWPRVIFGSNFYSGSFACADVIVKPSGVLGF